MRSGTIPRSAGANNRPRATFAQFRRRLTRSQAFPAEGAVAMRYVPDTSNTEPDRTSYSFASQEQASMWFESCTKEWTSIDTCDGTGVGRSRGVSPMACTKQDMESVGRG